MSKTPTTIESLVMIERESARAADAARIVHGSAEFALRAALESAPVPKGWELGKSDGCTSWTNKARATVNVVWGGYRDTSKGIFLYWHPGQVFREDHQHAESLQEAMRLAMQPKRKPKRRAA